MTGSDLIKQLFICFSKRDNEAFEEVVREYIERERVVNNFLQMLDNFRGESILLAATNHQNILDPAIWRRFDDVIYYELPDEKARKALFELYMKSIKRESGMDLQAISQKSENLSPADIKMITQEAMKTAIINSRNKLKLEDLERSVDKFIRREKVKQKAVSVSYENDTAAA